MSQLDPIGAANLKSFLCPHPNLKVKYTAASHICNGKEIARWSLKLPGGVPLAPLVSHSTKHGFARSEAFRIFELLGTTLMVLQGQKSILLVGLRLT